MSILFRSRDASVLLLDGPRTIEEAQHPLPLLHDAVRRRRILSAEPPPTQYPHPIPPQAPDASSFFDTRPAAAQLADLMWKSHAERALEVLRAEYVVGSPVAHPPLYYPRITEKTNTEDPGDACLTMTAMSSMLNELAISDTNGSIGSNNDQLLCPCYIPPGSLPVPGNVNETLPHFHDYSPPVDLLVMDPPWPNRSAVRQRKSEHGYHTEHNMKSIRALLAAMPVSWMLAPGGVVAIWVTNRHALLELLQGSGGIFQAWGVRVIAEWMWLKVAADGSPIQSVEYGWRRPWERLIFVQRPAEAGFGLGGSIMKERVLISVPDVHSRKPNLRAVFAADGIVGWRGAEVFARNLTTGWASFGDEVMKFQYKEHWALE